MQDSDQKGETVYSGETVYNGETQHNDPQSTRQSQITEQTERIEQTEQNIDVLDHENLINWYTKIGYALILYFFFPIYFSSPLGSKLMFPNITLLGKGGAFANITLLYPLFAGILVLIFIKTLDDLKRGIAILSIGIIPIIIMHILKKDMISSIVQGSFDATLVPQLILLSLIGMYIGAKAIIKFDTQSARVIGGCSSILFLVLVLLPLGSPVPVFFSLFKMLTIKGMPGLMKIIFIILIISFLILMYAALLGLINFKREKNTLSFAEKIKKMIFLSIFIILGILILVIFSTPGNMSATLLIKMFLFFVGFIGLFAESIWDIFDNLQPRTVKGGALMNSPKFENKK